MSDLPPARHAALKRLEDERFDVLILGGGVNGAGVLRDLALRSVGSRLKLALVDSAHFSSGTSGRNSQLIHGGLRYLRNLEFQLVSEALAERAILLRTAPHLVEPLGFVIPLRDWPNALFYGAGLALYDVLAGGNRIEHPQFLSASQLHQFEPRLGDFVTAAKFFDCRVHSARLVILNIREAVDNGAVAVNHCSADHMEKTTSGTWRIDLRDRLTGRRLHAEAKTVVDARGAWSGESKLRLVRGSHLVFPRIGQSENAIAYFGRDGRIVFFVPWGSQNQFTLVGTTDVEHRSGADHVRISPDEVRYLLHVVEEVFPGTGPHQPVGAYSSLRPLLQDEGASATKASRQHRIWADSDGVVHIAGGKYTTYRLMSEEASDLVCHSVAPELTQEHLTAQVPICGNDPAVIRTLTASLPDLANDHGIGILSAADLVRNYGIDMVELLRAIPASPPDGLTRVQVAQIAFAVEHEFVRRLTDLMFVSTYWGYEQRWSTGSLAPYANQLACHLGWNDEQTRSEISHMLAVGEGSLTPAT